MKHIPLIRANIIKGFVAFLNELSVPVQRFLVEAKLPASALQQPEALLPLKQVFIFFEKAAHSEAGEYLGLQVGQRTQISDLGAFGRLLCQSLTLHDALQTGIQMIATYDSGERIWLKEEGDRVWFCHRFVDGIEIGRQQADHYSVMLMINLVRIAAGQQWRSTEVHLETKRMSGLDSFEPLSDARICFEQDATAIVFPRSFLSLPLGEIDENWNVQRCQDYKVLHSSAPATSVSGSIRQVICLLLQEGYPDIHLVAEIVGMSVRSFQRHLSEMDLTYSHLIAQVRFEKSVQLLQDPKNSLFEIASALGYTDAANFTRAFRRWAGVSPSEFRVLKKSKN